MRGSRRASVVVCLGLVGLCTAVRAAEPEPAAPSRDDVFDTAPEPAAPSRDDVFDTAPKPIVIREDPLAIGGLLYLRLATVLSDRGAAGDQRISMPNLFDMYLDARPEDRVRGFVSGRLTYDPTIASGDKGMLGQDVNALHIRLDQLWLKTDIARAVFLTIGQERIKWGATRLWNPTDFVNASRKDPLALFDERTGVPMLKVHVPIETWNLYGILFFGGFDHLDEVAGAVRLEMAFPATEIGLSAVVGKGRKTGVGLDLSTAIGPLDLTAELSVTDETDTPEYAGTFSFGADNTFDPATAELPTSKARGAWVPRVSAGLQYAFKPNDEDIMTLGIEYFWNPLGVDDPSLYPWLAIQGQLQPFYAGQHYLGAVFMVPQPGCWNDVTFTLSQLANLSDLSFVTRLDVLAKIHTRLTLEGYVQGHYGHRGGEFRFAMHVPDLPAIPGVLEEPMAAFDIAAPVLTLGVNLRISL